MTFKVDENLPVELAEDLRGLGHGSDTVVSEGLCGAPDPVVVLFRPDSAGRRAVLSFVRARLSELFEMPLAGRLTIVGASRIRVR